MNTDCSKNDIFRIKTIDIITLVLYTISLGLVITSIITNNTLFTIITGVIGAVVFITQFGTHLSLSDTDGCVGIGSNYLLVFGFLLWIYVMTYIIKKKDLDEEQIEKVEPIINIILIVLITITTGFNFFKVVSLNPKLKYR